MYSVADSRGWNGVGSRTAGRFWCGWGQQAQRRTVRRSQRRAGLEGVRLEFFEVRQQFLFVGPTLQIEADHFVGS